MWMFVLLQATCPEQHDWGSEMVLMGFHRQHVIYKTKCWDLGLVTATELHTAPVGISVCAAGLVGGARLHSSPGPLCPFLAPCQGL